MNIIGTTSPLFSCKILCNSYPSIFGIIKSDKTISGRSRSKISIASAPLVAVTTSYFVESMCRVIINIISSSSTIKILLMRSPPPFQIHIYGIGTLHFQIDFKSHFKASKPLSNFKIVFKSKFSSRRAIFLSPNEFFRMNSSVRRDSL